MNLDIFNEPDPSGKMSKESFLIKNHKEEYKHIINYCIDNDLINVSFKEKVYLCLNNLKEVPKCKNPNCDKKVKFKNSTLGYLVYCSYKCVSSDPEIKKIKEEKSLEKWGTKTPAESDIIKRKIIETNNLKYGGNSAMSSKDIQEKSKETLMKNWGVDSPSRSKDILERRVKSFKENIDQYKESYKKTSLEKYGVDHPWKLKEIHDKSVNETKKYKIKKTLDSVSKMIPSGFKINNICTETSQVSINCDQGHEFTSNRGFIYDRFRNNTEICTICNPQNSQKSGHEILLVKFIKEIYDGEIIENEREKIKPFEIDIYLPEIKLGFEFNGLWWHSDKFREYDYHQIKQEYAEKSNINLITIWEDDWVNKTDIVKSFIKHRLKKTDKKIFAKNCEIIELKKKESDLFLEENHWSGRSNSSIRIGLINEECLYFVMTFKKKGDSYILDRYCSRKYRMVVGGFNKLLNYFINKYNPISIINYNDPMFTNGDIFKNSGFSLIRKSPTYKLLINKERVNRLNLGDYPKIWNSGLNKYIFKN